MKLYPEVKMKYQMMARYLHNFSGFSKKELEDFFAEIAVGMHGKQHPTVFERLRKHKEAGYQTMVVSGSFTPLLEAFLKEFPVDTIIGTDIPYKNGMYDAGQKIDHVQADRKAILVKEFTDQQNIDWENSYSYADSYTDLPVLKLVGNPVVVTPEEKLKEIALEEEWEILY